MDVDSYLQGDDRLMMVFGACEQHAYLSLLTDVRIPLVLADLASKQTGVLVAPPLNFGVSPYFMGYPGTLSLRMTTLASVAEDLLRSAYRHGFRRVLVLNGHGGNSPARQRLGELNNDLPELRLDWYDWWASHAVEAVAREHGLKPGHANWLEAFDFTIVNDPPEDDKAPPRVPRSILEATAAREIYGDGSFGGAYRASGEVSGKVLQAALQDVLALLRFE